MTTTVRYGRMGSSWLILSAMGAMAGCSENQGSKAWSSLATCVVGDAAQSAPAERMKQLRAIQLSYANNGDKANTWPARCATYANQLYAALDGSGPSAALKRNLQSKLGCGGEKPSCVLNDETVVTLVSDLWDGAKSSELKLEPVASVAKPEISQKPLFAAADWHGLSKQAGQIVGPRLTSEGRVQLLVKAPGARVRPLGCEFKPGFASVECAGAAEKMPALPPQSIQLVDDDHGLYVAGLTESGLTGFDLRSGEPTEVRGAASNVLREGLAVERGENDKGFAVYVMAKGKAGKPVELPLKEATVPPMSLGSEVVWVEPGEGGPALIIRGVKGNKLVERATIKGPFVGSFHQCRHGDITALATWAGHTGQHGARPSLAGNKTQLAISISSKGSWSKAFEAVLPFQRSVESELVCANSGASLVWATSTDGALQVSRLDCTAEGCKVTESKLPNFESRWWWAAGPVGDKVLLLWRAGFGEARMRIAPLSQLEQAKEQVLFDDQEHGGPKAGEAISIYSSEAALLLFKDESPVALTIGADGSARVIEAK